MMFQAALPKASKDRTENVVGRPAVATVRPDPHANVLLLSTTLGKTRKFRVDKLPTTTLLNKLAEGITL
jgi:hypothetical protein